MKTVMKWQSLEKIIVKSINNNIMKLYANVKSDRACKGQGGNNYIEIDLTCGSESNRIDAGTIRMKYIKLEGSLNENDEVELSYFKTDKGYQVLNTIKIPQTKGKKQKTAKQCDNCNIHITDLDYANGAGLCQNCK